MFHFLTTNSVFAKDLGLLILRVGIGLIFMKHGWKHLTEGTQTWQWMGSHMALLGIRFYPVFWGFLAACSEFFGGLLLTVGLYSRVASFCLACVMFVAITMHMQKGDAYTILSHPLSILVVFLSLLVSGSGRFSLDWLFGR